MNRLVGALFCLFLIGLLAGCGNSSAESREVTMGGFSFLLPQEYVSVSSATVENKQLINKVIGSFKIPAQSPGGFEPNIIVTRSDLPPELNYEQFRTLNAQKMSAGLAGYQPGTKEVVNFICNDREIPGLLVYFRLQDPRYATSPEVWLAQYQFVDNQKGYIVSAAYQTQEAQQDFVQLVESLACLPTEEEKTTKIPVALL